jgi:site-specific DNA-adenine methylase
MEDQQRSAHLDLIDRIGRISVSVIRRLSADDALRAHPPYFCLTKGSNNWNGWKWFNRNAQAQMLGFLRQPNLLSYLTRNIKLKNPRRIQTQHLCSCCVTKAAHGAFDRGGRMRPRPFLMGKIIRP